jgi:hypothetical protein
MRMLLATVLAAAAVGAVTEPATNVTGTTATVNGTVEDATAYFFEYETTASGTPDDFELNTPSQPIAGSGPVKADLTGLTPNTEYRFRVVATDGTETATGDTLTFRTSNPRPPTIDGQNSHDVGVDSAIVEARLNPRGSTTSYRFEYGTGTRYGRQTAVQTLAPGAPTVVQAPVSGLRPRTTYHWRLVATNAAGTTRGRDRRFTTLRLPTAVTLSLSPRTVTWGRSLNLGGRASGSGVSGMTVGLEAQQFPFASTFTPVKTVRTGRDGGYLFNVPDLWTTTRYRVVTRTRIVAVSPVVQANSRLLTGRRVRHFSRTRARISGSVFPAVAGTATLQRRTRRGWRSIRSKALRPRDSVRARYAFRVWRVKRRSRRYRVVATPDPATGHVRGISRQIKVKPRRRRR